MIVVSLRSHFRVKPSRNWVPIFRWFTVAKWLLTNAISCAFFPSFARAAWSHDAHVVFQLVQFSIFQSLVTFSNFFFKSRDTFVAADTFWESSTTSVTQTDMPPIKESIVSALCYIFFSIVIVRFTFDHFLKYFSITIHDAVKVGCFVVADSICCTK